MRHNTLVALFEQFATEHNIIANGADGRKSFFLMNKESELVNALPTQIDSPYLALENASGRMKNSGDVADEVTVVFEIRQAIGKVGGWADIESARDQCKQIGDQIIAYIDEICEVQGHCGPIDDFDAETVAWEYIGPMADNHYGVRFRFAYSKTAYNQYGFDSGSIFSNGDFNYLADDDGEFLADDDDAFLTN